MQYLGHFGSLGELLAWVLAAWMAAGWLVDGLAGAGWLAGRAQGPQDLRASGQWVVKVRGRGADNNQPDGYKTGTRKLTRYKAVRL